MPAPDAAQKRSRPSLILSFYLPAMLLAFSQGLLIPVLPLFAKSLEASYGLVGLVSAGTALGMLIGDVPGGVLVRKLGQKTAMLSGIGCTALATIGVFWARSIPEVAILRVVTGFGTALYSVSRHAYVADAVRTSGRGRAISLLGGLFRIGGFVGPLIGGTIAQAYGLRAPFLVVGTTSAVAFAAVAAFVRPAANRTDSQPPPVGGHLVEAMRARWRVLASAGTGQLFAQMIRAGRGIVIPLYAADVVGLDVQAIGLIVSLSSAVDMMLFYPAGLIMDRKGRKWAIVPSFLIQALGMSLVPLTGSFVGLLFTAMLIGFGNGFSSGSMMTLGADLAPEHARGEFLGVWRLIGDVGSSGGPLIVGSIADAFALPVTALLMGGAGLMAGLVFGLFVPETLKRRQPKTRLSASGD
jgi:MFS family permease